MNRTRGGCALLILAVAGVFFFMYPFAAMGRANVLQIAPVHSGISMWLLVVLIGGVGMVLLAVNDVREAILSLKDQPTGLVSSAPVAPGTAYQHLRAATPAAAHIKLTGVARECSACGAAVPAGAKSCSQCKAVFATP